MYYLAISFIVLVLFLLFQRRKNSLELALSKTPNLALLITDKHGSIKFINKKFEAIFGLKRKELLRQNLKEFLSKFIEYENLNELFSLKNTEQNIRETIIKKDEKYLRFSLSNILKNAKFFDGFILTITDITHEKELEFDKIKNEQMLISSSKMAVVGEMVSAISHQQRSPLSAVMLSLDEIDECVVKSEYEAINLQINRAKSSINLINETINAFSKFYKNDEKIADVDISLLVGELVFIVKPKLNQNGINLELNYDKNEQFIVRSIGTYIKQILLSLIANAKDELVRARDGEFIPSIIINLNHIKDEICISISDNGDGINQEKRIFEPFFTTKGESGTGMGLYIADILAHQKLGARLVLESKKEPTKFCLYIKYNIKNL